MEEYMLKDNCKLGWPAAPALMLLALKLFALTDAFADDSAILGAIRASGRIEQRACGAGLDPANRQCASGLFRYPGKNCLFDVTYVGETEKSADRVCTMDCANGARPIANQCSPCAAAFDSKPIWRSAAAINPTYRGQLAGWYSSLAELLRASSGRRYALLGGDAKRVELKRNITKMVLNEMLPFDAYCSGRELGPVWDAIVIRPEYSDENSVVVPMMTVRDGQINIYESSFYLISDRRRTDLPGRGQLQLLGPNELAAGLLHELLHRRQKDFGYVSGRYTPDAVLEAEVALNEIQVYDWCEASGFYQAALTPPQRQDLVYTGRAMQYKRFYDARLKMDKSDREMLANWAWQNDWMRRQMLLLPASDQKIWGVLVSDKPSRGRGR
jgi:hypothetical protein